MTPETHFAENDGVSIAYQVFGDGPQDLIYIPGWLSNLDIFWEEPRVARCLLSLARFTRVIVIDRRGTGNYAKVGTKRTLRNCRPSISNSKYNPIPPPPDLDEEDSVTTGGVPSADTFTVRMTWVAALPAVSLTL
jgi:pimeloyl-ACP methyl ester carboxylesterase